MNRVHKLDFKIYALYIFFFQSSVYMNNYCFSIIKIANIDYIYHRLEIKFLEMKF